MAILPAIPGLEIEVVSGTGESFETMKEYPDEEHAWEIYENIPPAKKIAQYIECVTGTKFKIKITRQSECKFVPDSLSIGVDVDGRAIARLDISREVQATKVNYIDGLLEKISPTEITSKTLRFCSLKKLDDVNSSQIAQDVKLAMNLGNILVRVYRAKITQQSTVHSGKNQEMSSITEISEKALKGRAISHGTSYGQPKLIKQFSPDVTYLDGKNNPLGIYCFKYRSRKALQSEYIIPRSPSPDSSKTASLQRSTNNIEFPATPAQERVARLERELAAARAEAGLNIKVEIKTEDEHDQKRKRTLENDQVSNDGKASKARNHNGKKIYDLAED